MGPVVVAKRIHLLGLVVWREIYDLLNCESHVVLISEQINLLLIVHDIHALVNSFMHIILDALAVRFKYDQFATSQLVDFVLGDLIRLRWMEFDLPNLVNVSTGLGKENLFIVASDQVPPDHSLRLADEPEEVAVQGGLHDTVIELDNQHVLFVGPERFRDELAGLNLVVVEALLVLDVTRQVLFDLVTLPVLGWNDANISTEDVERLLDDLFVTAFCREFLVLKPWVRLEAHKSALVFELDKNHDVTVCLL